MNKFHSVFVTSSGQAFSCGIGQGGKLGLGSEATVIIPQKINLEAENCLNSKIKKLAVIVEAALGTHHTILLAETGNVSLTFFSCFFSYKSYNVYILQNLIFIIFLKPIFCRFCPSVLIHITK